MNYSIDMLKMRQVDNENVGILLGENLAAVNRAKHHPTLGLDTLVYQDENHDD